MAANAGSCFFNSVAGAAFLAWATCLAASAAPPPPAGSPGYAGSEACKACHEEIFNKFQKTPHYAVESDSRRGWEHNSCESCHGPGQKHADSGDAADIRQPAKLKAPETDRICLTCHLNMSTPMGRIAGGHAKDEVACTTCHSIHGANNAKLVLHKQSEINALCANCHISQWAAFQRPYKHRLPEGAMSCVDCHNPHGSFRPETMRYAFGNEPGCLNCHSDKRGPFSFEHAPMRLEGCAACHEPHGSANPRMLIRHEQRLVCLECHANLPLANQTGTLGGVPPAFHDLNNPRFQNCTVCHVKIHGSYVDRALLR